MPHFQRPGVIDWLTAGGWSPTRDIGDHADDLIRIRVEDAARQGCELRVFDTALHFIRSFGELELPAIGSSREVVLVLDPTAGYEGDAEDFIELADNLGRQVFPVGVETRECGLWLIDDIGRFFYHHHTGNYFLGRHEREAFSVFLAGNLLPDAEDYFA